MPGSITVLLVENQYAVFELKKEKSTPSCILSKIFVKYKNTEISCTLFFFWSFVSNMAIQVFFFFFVKQNTHLS